ncbi:radical SAM/SPASM domain-containing protein [Ectothiorhodospira variabilis]|uniref:radical SAM/SPASM domain-containing protein n=1 Tax=Ectothiorhodospira variabilis TaxID=505694 RepID=UPI001EFB2E84|nr:radical SAM protein [Ectothiorhodospira variabilis]MCG5497506.1 radical SAM protein [Ectothiorhodospira variabilis]
MTPYYLEDLNVLHVADSWFLLRSATLKNAYLYNNESCELGMLPEVAGPELEKMVARIIDKKKVVSKSSSSPEKYIERKETPRLMLFLTASCNMRCVYCHCKSETDKAHMSEESALSTVGRYIEHVRKFTGHADNIEITFMGGGEPFLRIGTIKKIVGFLEGEGIQGQYVIVTNATVGNDSDWEWVVSKDFRVTISADGPPSIQDKQRVFAKNLRGTSSAVEKRLDWLSQYDIEVNIRSTVMDVAAPSVKSICDYYNRFSCVKTHHLEPVSFAGRGESHRNISEEEFYREFFKSYSPYLFENPKRFKSAWFKPFKKSHGFCGAVYFNAVVTHDGYVSLCSEVDSSGLSESYGHKYLVSHIQDDNPFLPQKSLDFSRQHSINAIPECQECIVRYKCGGGCYIKRDRDFKDSAHFHDAFCRNAIILNMSYLIGSINDAALKDVSA